MRRAVFALLLAAVLLSGGCASRPPTAEEKYRPDPDAEKALQERLNRMRRENQGF